MTPKTDVSMSLGLYAQQTAFVPTSPELRYAEHGLCHRRHIRPRSTSRILLPSLAPQPTAYCRKSTFLNYHEREEGEVAINSEDALDVLTDDEKNANEATTPSSVPIETNPSVDISVLGIPLRSIILLNLVAIIWGTQHSVIKSVVDDSVVGGNGFGFTSWAEHVFGVRWEQLMSTLRYSTTPTYDTGGNNVGAAAYFTLARFSIAALLAARYTPGLTQRTVEGDEGDNNGLVHSQSTHPEGTSSSSTTEVNLTWRYGIELGLYMFLGYGFQAIGLQTTTASRSGFLLYLNVKLVPFFSFLLLGKKIQKNTWISALVAFAGTALLALDNASDGTAGLDASFTVGDLWSIAAAAASALFILRMETASKAVSSAELNAANLWTVAFLSLVWTVWVSFNSLAEEATAMTQTLPDMLVQTLQYTFAQTVNTITSNPLQLIYLSAVTTAFANYIQSIAQKEVSAERASIFFALDPVYGAAFANILLGETLGSWGWVGASLIVIAAATNAVYDFGTTDDGSNTNKNV